MGVRDCFCMEIVFFAVVMVIAFIWLGWVVLNYYTELDDRMKEQEKRLQALEYGRRD